MAYTDLRHFIQTLESTGDLIRVRQEVDWELEIGAIVRRVCEIGAPAPLFENVKDYPGMAILGAPLATYRRLALALGLDPSSHPSEMMRDYSRRIDSPIAPRRVQDGPCKENVRLGQDVDLFEFPVPLVHEGDGGRYIGSWHFVVTRDPTEGWVNWGMYRLMLYDETNMACRIDATSDCGRMLQRYEAERRPMPFAVVFGSEPLSDLASCASLRWGEEAARVAGGLRGEPLELVRCETVDLEVPASAEVVLEGEVSPGVTLEEGPFGEYIGYRGGARSLRPAFHVKAVTFRNNAILPMTCMGTPTDEGQLIRAFTMSASAQRSLEEAGIAVTGVWIWPESTHHTMVVALRRGGDHSGEEVANLIFGGKLGFWMHQLILVDDDVDVYNLKEVIHSFATRCHPIRDVRTFQGIPTASLMPYLTPEEKAAGVGTKVCFDCRWKGKSPRKISFRTAYPQHIVERVLENWQFYGFD